MHTRRGFFVIRRAGKLATRISAVARLRPNRSISFACFAPRKSSSSEVIPLTAFAQSRSVCQALCCSLLALPQHAGIAYHFEGHGREEVFH